MSINEIWKRIPIDRLSNYEVSDQGRIRHRKYKKIRLFSKHWAGHSVFKYKIKGFKKNYYVHTLVMLAFKGERKIGMVINHKNNIKHDNRLSNLEYITQKGNTIHYYENFHIHIKGGNKQKAVNKIKELYEGRNWNSAKEFYEEIVKLFSPL